MQRSTRPRRGTLPARTKPVKKAVPANGEGERPATRDELRQWGVSSDLVAMRAALEEAYGEIVEQAPGRLLLTNGRKDRVVEQLERGILAGVRAQARTMYATIEAGRRASGK